MKKRLLASLTLFALVGTNSALAADMPVYKAPPPAVAFSWTGFYVGANAGYSWGRSSNDWNFLSPEFPGGSTTCFPPAAVLCVSGSESTRLRGAIGGFQAGYNWQTANYLIGVETDIQLSGQKGDALFGGQSPVLETIGGVPVAAVVSAAYTEKLLWLGTLRGRLGYASDRWLVYATGGLAYGRITIDGSATATGVPGGGAVPGAAPCAGVVAGVGICPLANFSNGVTKAGWTLGFGAEGAIVSSWSWKIEYLHVDLGEVNTSFATLPGCFGGGSGGGTVCLPVLAGRGTITSRITDDIVRIGVNYRFDAYAVTARY